MSRTFRSISQSNNAQSAEGKGVQDYIHTVTEGDGDIVQEDVIKITLIPMETKEQITTSWVPCYVHSAVSTYLTHKKVGNKTKEDNAKLEANSV